MFTYRWERSFELFVKKILRNYKAMKDDDQMVDAGKAIDNAVNETKEAGKAVGEAVDSLDKQDDNK
ncbi:hypothetical protein ESY86_02640 [Subsaximicrobium wynnwilliamsii]|uniref:Uncharacterized protein n=1 Tax=Subsaximicrobium wynnwilliamsii TaxID=291179 RepID=A0A5C6ZLW2_9FLAO|nr:hypothetical protein [Subsaximicrobium wynnwilliamsii]TXD85522.1 hypothetical protein ESY87_00950 [Subsaximicrobium wynnwilliamsii]TXD90875.1 hypothetical protein ESY86_02640 [Subsaximicrobium wynnwilliamsii]TXE05382.1 hypothetical protein ESY88_00950 [Subsaximicrobium wynnwilliamsii]